MSEAEKGRSLAPALYVVATPLGNPADLSPRARLVLALADLVLAEDTRRAGLLFRRLGVERRAGRGFVSFFEHNEAQKTGRVVKALERGLSVALISDAGTPLISDPGYRLVRACREKGLPVIPVPGPSAALAALSCCGLPPQPFTFLGFLPRSAADLKRLFLVHADTGASLVFFESKNRLAKTLALAGRVLGDRPVCLARELTKDHEEFILGRLPGAEALAKALRGEITVVVGPLEFPAKSDEQELARLIR
ncbi:MAG: 16S rRNA (cytidine(1402)-2'-O)-methyltransferase, partial [Desulfovibrionaceae bacterium]|nr:16S rRNA (cytidine(1402)-2'-O)-methyltransferase [Desulfovibrionaceae bacterium]